jgi:hypothetical protein
VWWECEWDSPSIIPEILTDHLRRRMNPTCVAGE